MITLENVVADMMAKHGEPNSTHSCLRLWTASILTVLHQMGADSQSNDPLIISIYKDGSGRIVTKSNSLIFDSIDQLAELITERMEKPSV